MGVELVLLLSGSKFHQFSLDSVIFVQENVAKVHAYFPVVCVPLGINLTHMTEIIFLAAVHA